MQQWLLVVPLLLFAASAAVAGIGFCVQAADRNTPLVPDIRTVAMIAREAGARIVLGALELAALFEPARPLPPPPDRPRLPVPILLVPGLTWSSGSTWPLATFLTQRGARVRRLRRPGRTVLATEAGALANEIDAVLAATGGPQVDLVAFSTGGLVAAWYLRSAGAAKVRRLVTIATPWQGTRMAVFARGAAVDEVRYGSHLLDGLWPPPVPTTCVFSPDDPVVVPASSALPRELGRDGAIVAIDSGGHVDLLLSARVYRAVQAALS